MEICHPPILHSTAPAVGLVWDYDFHLQSVALLTVFDMHSELPLKVFSGWSFGDVLVQSFRLSCVDSRKGLHMQCKTGGADLEIFN